MKTKKRVSFQGAVVVMSTVLLTLGCGSTEGMEASSESEPTVEFDEVEEFLDAQGICGNNPYPAADKTLNDRLDNSTIDASMYKKCRNAYVLDLYSFDDDGINFINPSPRPQTKASCEKYRLMAYAWRVIPIGPQFDTHVSAFGVWSNNSCLLGLDLNALLTKDVNYKLGLSARIYEVESNASSAYTMTKFQLFNTSSNGVGGFVPPAGPAPSSR